MSEYINDLFLIITITFTTVSAAFDLVLMWPSVCPIWAHNLKTKNVEKSKLVLTFPRARVSGLPIFSKVTGRQKPPQQSGIMFTYGWRIMCRRLRCRLQIRPNHC